MRHALVLSGGGAKGSYGAGAAMAIGEWFDHTDSPISILSGTSVGGLNAAAIASGGWRRPMELWWTVNQRKVYREPGLSLLGGLIALKRRGAVYDSSPLRRLVEETLEPAALAESPFDLYVHTLDLLSGRQVVFRKDDPDIVTGTFASASVPGAFPPVAWKGTWLVDGGTVDNSPIRTAIRAGAEKVTVIYLDDDMPREPIDARDFTPREPAVERPDIAAIISSTIESMTDAHFQRDLQVVRLRNDLAQAGLAVDSAPIALRVFAAGRRPMPQVLDFDNRRARRLLNLGYHDARDWLRGRR